MVSVYCTVALATSSNVLEISLMAIVVSFIALAPNPVPPAVISLSSLSSLNSSLVYDLAHIEIYHSMFKKCDWTEFYQDVKENISINAPEPRRKEVDI